jgi:transcriptional regulator with XRE-family HTH domain
MIGARRAATLLRDVRRASGISQAELARRAGMTRSVVNAYERGTRQPSVAALTRLAAAGGFELTLARRQPPVDPSRAGRILEQVLGLAEQLPYRPGIGPEVAPLPPSSPKRGSRR